MNKTFLIFIILLLSYRLFAQKADSIIIIKVDQGQLDGKLPKKNTPKPQTTQASGNSKIAKGVFDMANYREALKEYIYLHEKNPDNVQYKYRLGVCYLRTNVDKSKAIPLLEAASKATDLNEPMVWYFLGEAYMHEHRFDDAIKAFQQFKQVAKGKEELPMPVDRQIQMCNNAKELVAKPVKVSFENLGPLINSPEPDYNPFVPQDESFIVFNSKRASNMGKTIDYDGFVTPDVYWNVLKNDRYQKTKSLGPVINTELVEEVVGLSPNGENLLLFYDNQFGSGDVFVSQKKGKSFQKASVYYANINTDYIEMGACLNATHDTLYFASNKPDGSFGGYDLYYSVLLPSGIWGLAVNLGKEINTEYDENYPWLAPDGRTLYFASEGHNSMGGYDLFKSVKDPNTGKWSKPVNLGYPVNSTMDDNTICFNRNGKYAYMAKYFKNAGEGDLDIYRLNFEDVKPLYSLVTVKILTAEGLNIYDALKPPPDTSAADTLKKDEKPLLLDFTIKAYDKDSTLKGIYKLDNITRRFAMYLPTGDYKLHVVGHGYDCLVPFNIPEKAKYAEQYSTEIFISRKEEKINIVKDKETDETEEKTED